MRERIRFLHVLDFVHDTLEELVILGTHLHAGVILQMFELLDLTDLLCALSSIKWC